VVVVVVIVVMAVMVVIHHDNRMAFVGVVVAVTSFPFPCSLLPYQGGGGDIVL
jgi:hypothetical protein